MTSECNIGGLNWCIYWLLRSPEIQEKTYARYRDTRKYDAKEELYSHGCHNMIGTMCIRLEHIPDVARNREDGIGTATTTQSLTRYLPLSRTDRKCNLVYER